MQFVTSKDGTKIADEAQRVWRWLVVAVAVVAVLAGAGWVGLAASTSRSQLARAIVRGDTLLYEGYFNEEDGGPWGDDTATYYAPDLRKLALEAKLRRPLGMEAGGSWSLDSQASGFEKMESGLNARAADFARFGLLLAHDGAWRGRQLVPKAWVRDPTLVPTRFARAPTGAYQYFWWVQDQRRPRAQFARGKYGQHVYVVPDSDLVLVRFGRDSGYPYWPELLDGLARRLDEAAPGTTTRP